MGILRRRPAACCSTAGADKNLQSIIYHRIELNAISAHAAGRGGSWTQREMNEYPQDVTRMMIHGAPDTLYT